MTMKRLIARALRRLGWLRYDLLAYPVAQHPGKRRAARRAVGSHRHRRQEVGLHELPRRLWRTDIAFP